jgi:hypothetical protein
MRVNVLHNTHQIKINKIHNTLLTNKVISIVIIRPVIIFSL